MSKDVARTVRACEGHPNGDGYQATFSRNQMFRERIKDNAIPLAAKL